MPIIFLVESFSFRTIPARIAEKTMPPLLTQGKTMLPGKIFAKKTLSIFKEPRANPEQKEVFKNEGEGRVSFLGAKMRAMTVPVRKSTIIKPLCCDLNSLIAKIFCDILVAALQRRAENT